MSEADTKESNIPIPPPVLMLPPAYVPAPVHATKINNHDYVLESDDLHMIVPRLYLGSWQAASNVNLLKKLGITHILTIEETELEEDFRRHFVYKFKFLTDFPSSNVLELFDECFEFIDEAINNSTGIIVHCLVGRSRSASIVTGYLMKKEKKSLRDTLALIRESRFIRPNTGFHKQLQFFEKMDCELPKDSAAYKSFMLERLAEHVQRGGKYEEFKSAANENANSEINSSSNTNLACYKCKKCRVKLFTADKLVKHIKSYEKFQANDWIEKLKYYESLNKSLMQAKQAAESGANPNECMQELYIEPLDWFKSQLSDLNGKLNCPKCGTKLGSFDWCGSKCSCNTWVTPAFHISSSKVDFCPV